MARSAKMSPSLRASEKLKIKQKTVKARIENHAGIERVVKFIEESGFELYI